jgi:hypothetical protein
VTSWFQSLLFKCNLYRYIKGSSPAAAAAAAAAASPASSPKATGHEGGGGGSSPPLSTHPTDANARYANALSFYALDQRVLTYQRFFFALCRHPGLRAGGGAVQLLNSVDTRSLKAPPGYGFQPLETKLIKL